MKNKNTNKSKSKSKGKSKSKSKGRQRQPEETHKQMKLRTGTAIARLFREQGLQRAPERTLWALHQWAGRTVRGTEGNQGTPNALQRLFRCRTVEWVQDTRRKERLETRTRGSTQVEFRRSHAGHWTAWEGVLVNRYGPT
ncbi:hypothetical protein N9L19_00080 [bacterium]|nr:hypothetical protein [bacterium]